jgi:2-polyprenyl-3-methyl-5-hydroxy-6-metoxy-1,4-benzoquinol methylase
MGNHAASAIDHVVGQAPKVGSWESKAQRRRAISQHVAEALDRIIAWQIPGEDERDRDYVRCRWLDLKEITRYLEVILDYQQQGGGPTSVLDVGTTLGILPLTLRSMGINSSACDHPRFKTYAEWIEREGVPYTSVDLMDGDLPYASDSFDVITFKQVIEHLPCSPKAVLLSFRRILRPGGLLLLSTPNILRLSSVARLLGRRSIYPPIEQFFHSDFPFTGHYREYTLAELKSTLAWSGFEVLQSTYLQQYDALFLYRQRKRFTHNRFGRIEWKDILASAAWWPFTLVMPSLSQFIFVVARKPCS